MPAHDDPTVSRSFSSHVHTFLFLEMLVVDMVMSKNVQQRQARA